MKSCPRCEEDIEESAIICKHCGCNVNSPIKTQFGWIDALTNENQKQIKEQVQKSNLNPDPPELTSWLVRGMELMEPVEAYESEKSFDSLILYRVGLPQNLINNCIEAINCYNHALEIDPTHGTVLIFKSWALAYIKEWKKALNCCDEMIRYHPNRSFPWTQKGNIYRYMGSWDMQRAYLCYKKALQIDPNDTEAAAGLDNAGRRRPLRNMIPIIGDYLP
jgi:tetratricopeptide (TPR) repeat protein